MLLSGSHPKARICLSLSETKICVATVGARSEVAKEFNSTALFVRPSVLSQ